MSDRSVLVHGNIRHVGTLSRRRHALYTLIKCCSSDNNIEINCATMVPLWCRNLIDTGERELFIHAKKDKGKSHR